MSRRRRRPSRLGQISAFATKETADVLRQPWLLLVLVVGPFLILLAFGLGYQQKTHPYRTAFVMPKGSPLEDQVDDYAKNLGQFIQYQGHSDDEQGELRRLHDDKVDVIVVFPANPLDTVLGGHQATIKVVHNRLDPIEQTAIGFASQLAVDQINSQILAQLVGQGQQAAQPLSQVFTDASAGAAQLSQAVAGTDPQRAQQVAAELGQQVGRLAQALQSSQALVARFGGGGAANDAVALLADLQQKAAAMQDRLANGQLDDEVRARAQDLTTVLQQVQQDYDKFTHVEAGVLVRPFTSQTVTDSPATGRSTITDFYAPAAVVLLVQQFGVAFGALSFVRERQLGILEVFQAAPLGAPEAVLGKYVSYVVLGGLVGAALTAAVVGVLDVPMVGPWWQLAVALGLTLLASIGLGLVISLISATDTQAVQYTMIVLLGSLFFTGFFLTIDQLARPAQILTWAIPASYGMALLRDTMLRGVSLDPLITGGVAAYAFVAFLIVLVGARRRLSTIR